MKYINHTPWKLCLAPHGTLWTQVLAPCTLSERGYIKEEIVQANALEMPIHELYFSVELPPPQDDVVHIVTLKTKLCRELRDRKDVVAIGSGNQRALNDAIEIWDFVR